MDRSKLPLSLLVALGLAPEACTTKEPRTHPCLSPPADDSKVPEQPPDEDDPSVRQCLQVVEPDDPPVHACLEVMEPDPPDHPVGPCLEIAEPPNHPCLSPPVDPPQDPPVGPCLRVAPDPPVTPCLEVSPPEPPLHPCLSVPREKGRQRPPRKPDGGMASSSRHEIIERVRGALPPDVAARLPARDSDDA